MTTLAQVVDQMQHAGLPLPPPGHPILDGKVHRFGPQKKAWYVLREIPLKSGQSVIGGAFGRWQGTENNATKVDVDWARISPEERAAAEARQREIEVREQAKRARLARFAANRAKLQWEAAEPARFNAVPYLQRKGIHPESARCTDDGTLLVPMVRYEPEGRQLVGLQKIAPDGSKRFNRGTEKAGASLRLGAVDAATPVAIVCEGYATGATIRMALERSVPVVVAFDAGNLKPVASALRTQFPSLRLVFAADDDDQLEGRYAAWLDDEFQLADAPPVDGQEHAWPRATDGELVTVTARRDVNDQGVPMIVADARCGRLVLSRRFENAGVSKATEAARLVGAATVAMPVFAERGSQKLTDFNDLHATAGLEAVAQQLRQALTGADRPPRTPLSLVKTPAPSTKEDRSDEGGPDAAAGGGGKRRRPKKEFTQAHWDAVNHLLAHFVLIYGTDTAWDEVNRIIIRVNHLRLAYGSDAVKFWLNNAERRMVNQDQVVFDPTETCDPATTVNLFDGFKLTPKKGDCRQIVELIKFLCNDDANVLAWVLRWLAYPLQHPGAKMKTSIIIHGDEGSGKNLFFETVMREIYGEYGAVIGNAQIEGQFNEWASKKLFVVADEVVTRSELRQLKGKLKAMVTGDVIMINPKGMPERAESNHMNFVFLSNELQPLALDKSDRRYLVLWTPPKREPEFYRAVAEQAAAGGIAAFYHFLKHEVDLGDFTEHTKPIETDARERLISLGLSAPERFFREWSGGFLPLPFICCSAMQLYLGYARWSHLNGERFPVSQTMFGRSIDRVAAGLVHRTVIKYELAADVKQRTVYLVGEQPADRSRVEWVEGASSLFDDALKKYRHVFDQASE